MDPLSTEEEANAGKAESEGLRFELERLKASEIRLKARLEVVTSDKDQVERRSAFAAAVKARDEAAEALLTVYPKAAAEIRGMLVLLAEAEAKVLAANQNRPDGVEHIMGAEAKANGGVRPGTGENWPIAEQVRLPARFGSERWGLRADEGAGAHAARYPLGCVTRLDEPVSLPGPNAKRVV